MPPIIPGSAKPEIQLPALLKPQQVRYGDDCRKLGRLRMPDRGSNAGPLEGAIVGAQVLIKD
jgi:hypothetical protein